MHTFLLGRDIWIKVVYFPSIPSEADLEEFLSDPHTFFHVYVCDVSIRDQRLDLRKGRKEFYFVGWNGSLFVNRGDVEYKTQNEDQFNTWVMPLANELLAWVKVQESIRVFAFQTGFASILIRHFEARRVEIRPMIKELEACSQSIDRLKKKLDPLWTLQRDLLIGEAVTLETSLASMQLAGEVEAYESAKKNGEKMVARVQTLLQAADGWVLNALTWDPEHGAVEEVESPRPLRKRRCDDHGPSTKKSRTARLDCVLRQLLGSCLEGDQSVLSVGA